MAIKPLGDRILIKPIEQAEEIIGQELCLPEEQLPSLDDKELFYFHQIEGFTVITKDGVEVGVVKDNISVDKNDLLTVMKDDREVLIPFTRSICVAVDDQKRQIIIDPPEGLLDLNEI